jgi:hypothetical protein
MVKMSSFEAFVENAVKPGPERAIPGCACVAINKDGTWSRKLHSAIVWHSLT